MKTKKKKPLLYPGIAEVEKERNKSSGEYIPDPPEMIAGKPNYEAFPGWKAEKVLSFLNID